MLLVHKSSDVFLLLSVFFGLSQTELILKVLYLSQHKVIIFALRSNLKKKHFYPFISRIKLAILLNVCHSILMLLVGRSWYWVTAVGGRHPHHCIIPFRAPLPGADPGVVRSNPLKFSLKVLEIMFPKT